MDRSFVDFPPGSTKSAHPIVPASQQQVSASIMLRLESPRKLENNIAD